MQLVHVPHGLIDEAAPLWGPFLFLIEGRAHASADELASEIRDDLVQVHFVMNGSRRPVALIGTQIEEAYGRKTGIILWCAGAGCVEWFDLIADLEQWFTDQGCIRVKTACRPGWKRPLAATGYAMTHIVMEKEL